ncbi:MAG: S-layer homology domain-containing protein [Propionibacteriaceae bacterium]|jgi:hypothetical protein|nr:S-layer homology domain-containing protein [Propionibacteriaceae bacterium]
MQSPRNPIRVIVGAVALGLLTLGAPATLAHAADASSSPDSAVQLTLGTAVTETLSTTGTATTDTDCYQFDTTADGIVTFELSSQSMSGTSNAYRWAILYQNADGGWSTKGYNFTAANQYAGVSYALPLTAGHYVIQIYGESSWPSWGKTYTLKASFSASAIEVEPNSKITTATPVTLGTTYAGSNFAYGDATEDQDIYKFTFPSTGKVGLTFTFASLSGSAKAYTVHITDASSNPYASWTVAANQSSGAWTADNDLYLGAGDYYLWIQGEKADPSWGVKYQVKVTHTAATAETEFNDTYSTADTITLGTAYKGSALTAKTDPDSGIKTDHDFYKFTATAAGQLKIDFTYPQSSSTAEAYRLLVTSSSSPTSSTVANFTYAQLTANQYNGSLIANTYLGVQPGDYYLRVISAEGKYGWGKTYTLKVTVDSSVSGETEPNNSISQATALTLGQTKVGSSSTVATCQNSSSDTGYDCDRDIYKFTTTAVSKVTPTFTFANPGGTSSATAYSFKITNSSSVTYHEFTVTNGQYSGSWLSNYDIYLPAGDWYVWIEAVPSAAVWGKTYTVGVSATASANTESELNSTVATANPVALGATIKGSSLLAGGADNDYFSFNATAAGTYKLNFTFPQLSGTATAFKVQVLKSATEAVTNQREVKANEYAGTWTADLPVYIQSAGTYYIYVRGDSTLAGWGKTYNVGISKSPLTTAKPDITPTTAINSTKAARKGTKLTATTTGWGPSGVQLTYQWYRSKTNSASSEDDYVAVSGATTSTYDLKEADVLRIIRVKVTGQVTGYPAESQWSDPVAIYPYYNDVPPTYTFYSDINWAYENGIVSASNANFEPGRAMTRGEMAAYLFRLAGNPSFKAPTNPTFTDVPKTHTFYAQIEWLRSKNITTVNGQYRPSDSVPRADMAAFLRRFNIYIQNGSVNFPSPATPTYTDVPKSNKNYSDVEWMRYNGLAAANPQFFPLRYISRGEMIAFLHRYALKFP